MSRNIKVRAAVDTLAAPVPTASLLFCHIGVGNTDDAKTVWLDKPTEAARLPRLDTPNERGYRPPTLVLDSLVIRVREES